MHFIILNTFSALPVKSLNIQHQYCTAVNADDIDSLLLKLKPETKKTLKGVILFQFLMLQILQLFLWHKNG